MEKRKLCVFDFDGTLVDTPVGSPKNKQKWEDYYGKKWPYLGWWGRDESLDTKVWEMSAVPEVFDAYQKVSKDPNNVIVLLTGRLQKQEPLIKKIVNSLGYNFDHYLFNRGGNTLANKIIHLMGLLEKYYTVREIEMWDDRPEHFEEFETFGQRMKDMGRINSFYLNKIKSDQWDNFVE